MHLLRTCGVITILKERKLKEEFNALIDDLMGQIYF